MKPTYMALLCSAAAIAAFPALAQKIYKCPGPDGKSVYQQQRCPEGGGRMYIKDNGSGTSGAANTPVPANTGGATSSSVGSAPALDGLRPAERALLEKSEQEKQQREAAQRDALAAEIRGRQAASDAQRSKNIHEQLQKSIDSSGRLIEQLHRLNR